MNQPPFSPPRKADVRLPPTTSYHSQASSAITSATVVVRIPTYHKPEESNLTVATLTSLPNELLEMILQHLAPPDMANISRACPAFHRFSTPAMKRYLVPIFHRNEEERLRKYVAHHFEQLRFLTGFRAYVAHRGIWLKGRGETSADFLFDCAEGYAFLYFLRLHRDNPIAMTTISQAQQGATLHARKNLVSQKLAIVQGSLLARI